MVDKLTEADRAWARSIAAAHPLDGRPARARGNHLAAQNDEREPLQPVMDVLRETDDHLQAMQHYDHSRDLRKAMNTVGQLQDALAHLLRWHDQLKPADIKRAQAILDRAKGSAS